MIHRRSKVNSFSFSCLISKETKLLRWCVYQSMHSQQISDAWEIDSCEKCGFKSLAALGRSSEENISPSGCRLVCGTREHTEMWRFVWQKMHASMIKQYDFKVIGVALGSTFTIVLANIVMRYLTRPLVDLHASMAISLPRILNEVDHRHQTCNLLQPSLTQHDS